MLAGIPICMGYFAVSFALGIAARNTGMNALQSFVMSLTMVASAGQFAAIGLIGAGAGFIEMITTTLIVNLRYFLMSCSLTQKLDPDGYLHPFYTYGITFVSVSGWCAGTVLGVIVGNILPAAAADAMGVAMYGMFLAIIIPPAKKNHFVGGLVAVSMLGSFLFTVLPVLRSVSSGFRVIILTLVLAGAAALIRPIPLDPDEEEEEQ